jgi:histone arginine demethylase JMJD6
MEFSEPTSPMARRWLEPLGSSTLHNIRERGEEAVRVVDSLGAAPPAATTMEELRVDAAEQPLAASLSARTTPFVMRGAAKAWGWRAAERWSSAEALVAHYGDFEMDLADDVRLPLREYVEYAANNAADSPYYLVERSFQGERAALLDDFAPPSFFADDLLAEIPGSKRARYCFFGGARSGTFLHVDPLCTSAWNVCLAGRKRWCMLAPETDMAVHGLEHFAQGKHQLPVCWFLDEHPRLQRSAVAGKLTMIECVQGAGDMVFIPAGWHHAVVNLEWTSAVSQNFMAPAALCAQPRSGSSLWAQLVDHNFPFAMGLHEMLRGARMQVLSTTPGGVLHTAEVRACKCSPRRAPLPTGARDPARAPRDRAGPMGWRQRRRGRRGRRGRRRQGRADRRY